MAEGIKKWLLKRAIQAVEKLSTVYYSTKKIYYIINKKAIQ